MTQEELIPAVDFCNYHHIEITFLQSLQDYGLVEIQTVQETSYLHPDQLMAVEKFVHLHYDLDINLEGLDVINHMLERMENLQQEVRLLKNRLHILQEGD